MSKKILVGYATRYGSTEETAKVIAATLQDEGFVVDMLPVKEVKALADYSAIILGAPLFMFHWHKDVLRFLTKNQRILLNLQVAIFALGPTHDPYDEQEWRDSWSQLNKELENYSWLKPVEIELFGGKYDPAYLRFPLKMMAGKAPATDIRDFDTVKAWAVKLAKKIKA
ncbi:MAG TPA: flavodoxin domain-containing protein [Anaerolineaceae bacterium]|nr:flavodoxin domain-containing protein [Anaerolineaceae bacterium]